MTDNHVTRPQVLIVDADPESAGVLTGLLRDEYEISVTASGETALQIARSDKPPDLLLLAVRLPEMSGFDLCRALKSDGQTRNIPVIFMNDNDCRSDEVVGFEAGAADYIVWPLHPVIVKARVHTHIELKNQRDLLVSLAVTDGLTGVANRRKFDEHLMVSAAFASRNSFPLSLILIDIDFFKEFNDLYGQFQGDICLKKVARTIAGKFKRLNDLVARYGGEEFACILPSTKHHDAAAIAEQLRQDLLALRVPHEASTVNEFVTVSIGVATVLTFDNSSITEKIIASAERALAAAQEQGRNRVV